MLCVSILHVQPRIVVNSNERWADRRHMASCANRFWWQNQPLHEAKKRAREPPKRVDYTHYKLRLLNTESGPLQMQQSHLFRLCRPLCDLLARRLDVPFLQRWSHIMSYPRVRGSESASVTMLVRCQNIVFLIVSNRKKGLENMKQSLAGRQPGKMPLSHWHKCSPMKPFFSCRESGRKSMKDD